MDKLVVKMEKLSTPSATNKKDYSSKKGWYNTHDKRPTTKKE